MGCDVVSAGIALTHACKAVMGQRLVFCVWGLRPKFQFFGIYIFRLRGGQREAAAAAAAATAACAIGGGSHHACMPSALMLCWW